MNPDESNNRVVFRYTMFRFRWGLYAYHLRYFASATYFCVYIRKRRYGIQAIGKRDKTKLEMFRGRSCRTVAVIQGGRSERRP